MTFYCVIGVESRTIYDYSDVYDDVFVTLHELVSMDYFLYDLDEDLTILRVDSPYCANDALFLDYLKHRCKEALIL